MNLTCVKPYLLLLSLALGLSQLAVVQATSEQNGSETDRQSLLAFKAEISGDPNNVLGSWNQSTHFCRWRGVRCGREGQRVVSLDLHAQKLTGSLSPSIGNLSFLNELYLQNNSFIREIPPQIGRLRRLKVLWLNNNSFAGEIPRNISGCSNLVSFVAAFNKLRGKIPDEIGSLKKLQDIRIGKNNLTGEIPASIGNLTSLVNFSAPSNSLSGILPNVLGFMPKIEVFWVEDNSLTGTLPPTIFSLSSLKALNLAFNKFQGTLPQNIGSRFPNLEFFAITSNQFSGSVPVSLSNMSTLSFLLLGENQFTGKVVPTFEKLNRLILFTLTDNDLGYGEENELDFLSSLTNATNLVLICVSDNNFGGLLPQSIGNFSVQLRKFHVQDNQLHGSIPSGLTNLINMEELLMSNNQFVGEFPTGIEKLKNLQNFNISYNKLSGDNILSSVGNLSLLATFDIGDNNFHGNIPSSLGNCKKLLLLNLGRNSFKGIIPKAIFDLSSLSISLDLSHNQLVGSLPMEIGNLRNLQELDVSGNSLSGSIPSTLGFCVRLEKLNMSHNLFRGSIPDSLSSLRGIQFLDLSDNDLSGKIPNYLPSFDLQLLNLSFNNLEGVMPIFKNASSVVVSGNPRLCGGAIGLKLSPCSAATSKKVGISSAIKFIVPIAVGFFGLTLLSGVLYFRFYRKTQKKIEDEPDLDLPRNSLPNVSYQSLFQATDGFASANLIGSGSFGSVYKGVLDLDGSSSIAVKVFDLLNGRAWKSFIAECESLRNLKHRNLIKVLTACSSVDYHGNEFKALVYELMENGNLEEWLHESSRNNLVDGESKNLSFAQRLIVAIDVGTAIDYLHNFSKTPVVHCDLKPSNVLLDKDFTGHVGDFGLAKFLKLNNQSAQDSSTGLRGSIGYTAPEYGTGGKASTCGDVYSFGILLMEMFTGKRPTDGIFIDGRSLHSYVQAALPEKTTEIVDPILLHEMEEDETMIDDVVQDNHSSSFIKAQKMQDCLILILRIGVSCSAEMAGDRMRIADAVAGLQLVKDNLLGVSTFRK